MTNHAVKRIAPAPSAPLPACARPMVAQLCAGSPRASFLTDDRILIGDLPLPGPRRAREGRGGATDGLTTLRLLIRCPLLVAMARSVAARSGGRPAAVPDLFWVFYLCAIREFASAYKLDQELRQHWKTVQEEFFWEYDIRLPDAKRNGDVPGYHSFKAWRRKNVLGVVGAVEVLSLALTKISVPLALAIRRAEGGDDPRDLLEPAIWDCVAADGSVFDAPSDVRRQTSVDADGNEITFVEHARKKDSKHPRVHDPVTESVNKGHGATKGLFNVAAVTKGLDTYTRVVLAVEIGDANEGEAPIAMRTLRQLYSVAGLAFPVLLYDGGMMPVNFQQLMAEFGVYTVNANYARRGDDKAAKDGSSAGKNHELGYSVRMYGTKKGQPKLTYTTPLPSIDHECNGQVHAHHLVADDGGVWEVDRAALSGGEMHAIELLEPTQLRRVQDHHGEFYFELTLTGDCPHGGRFSVSYELRKTKTDRRGSLPWASLIANIRVLPEALVEQYAAVFGWRNQVESFFSWLEKCFHIKDRAASWNRPAQLLDLIGAALLHNAEAWAHLAQRHPADAEILRVELAALITGASRSGQAAA